MKACFYGKPGVGKTWVSLSFPNPVVIDMEKGTALYGSDFNFDVLRSQDIAEIDAAVDELMEDPQEFRTLIIDPMSVYCDLAQEEFLRQKRIDTMDPHATISGTDWTPIKGRIKRFVNKLLSLDMNIIVTAREKPVYKKGTFMEIIGVMPDMHKDIPHMFDTTIYVFIDPEGKRKGIAHPEVEPGVVAKDRSKLPHEIFDFNYETLTQYWGIDGLSRKADAMSTGKNYSESLSRTEEITRTNGNIIKTAGINADQLDIIEGKIGKDKTRKAEVVKYLQNTFAIESILDLRKDEADLVISALK